MNDSMSGILRVDLILNAIITIILGILFIVNPLGASESSAIIISVFLIFAGVADIVQFIYEHVKNYPSSASMIGGLVKIALALFAVSHMGIVLTLFSLIISIFVIVCGVSCVEASLDMRRCGNPWVLCLILAIIVIIGGILMLFEPFEALGMTFMFIGIALIFSGIAMIVMSSSLSKVR